MDMFDGFFYTPGWGALMTLVGTLGGVVATQFAQAKNTTKQIEAARDRWNDEATERHRDSLREAVAEVLASQLAVVEALNKVQAAKMNDRIALSGSNATLRLSEGHQQSNAVLSESVKPLHLAVERVRLLTQSESLLSALDSLVDALVAAFKEAGVVAQEYRHVATFAEKQGAVNKAFTDLTDVAQKELARPSKTATDERPTS